MELHGEEGSPLHLKIESHWFHKRRVIFKFQGINTIAGAELLIGYELRVPFGERFSLPEGYYYHFDLQGCLVKDLQGQPLGEVVEVLDVGGNCLLKISSQHGEFLMPFALAFLKHIDLQKRELVCDLPEGLMNL